MAKTINKVKPKRVVRIRTTVKQCKEAIEKNSGFITKAAKALGITREALAKRIAVTPKLQEVVDDTREHTLDLAESGLRDALMLGEKWAIEFYLKMKGSTRNYQATAIQKVGGIEGGAPIEISDKERLQRINSLFGK